MYVNDETQKIYLGPPRTASRSVAQYLSENGFDRVGGHHEVVGLWAYPEHEVFTVVRNPFDAWLSLWAGSKTLGAPTEINRLGFERYLLKNLRKRRYGRDETSMWRTYTSRSDVVLRHETLVADLSAYLGQEVDLPHIGRSSRERDYRGYYGDLSRAYLEESYLAELEELSYRF